jgi:hypothetical protein
MKVLMNPDINFNSLTSLSVRLSIHLKILFSRMGNLRHLTLTPSFDKRTWTLIQYNELLTS